MSATLSSDVLEHQFGPTTVEVLRQEEMDRIICTKAVAGGQVLEISRVIFHPEGIAAFPKIHHTIAAGASMGKAFAAAGIPFSRHIQATYRFDQHRLPNSFSEHFGTPGPSTVIDVSIAVGPENTPYADILEVYSPAVSWELASSKTNHAIVDRLRIFGAELAALSHTA